MEKPPSAGLWVHQTGEDALGITYGELDAVLEAIERVDTGISSADLVARVEQMVAASEHKRHMPWTFLGC
jgi:NH3-dependent NAD+ synthetase